MKKLIVSLLSVAILAGCCCCDRACAKNESDGPRISVFASFVKRVSKERKLTLAQAADRLYALGIRGFDIGPEDEALPALAATKLKPINFYFLPKWLQADGDVARCRACLDTAVRYGVPRIMIVPPHFTSEANAAAEFEVSLAAMKRFVAEAKTRGITVTVEDFGGTSNPCSHVKYLKRFLEEIPDLRFALDSGNLYFAGRGESILKMMEYAKARVAHVHLKDQTAENNRKYATLGLGAVPNAQIVRTLNAAGYAGWYTLENTVGDTYDDSVRQVAVLKAWLGEQQ